MLNWAVSPACIVASADERTFVTVSCGTVTHTDAVSASSGSVSVGIHVLQSAITGYPALSRAPTVAVSTYEPYDTPDFTRIRYVSVRVAPGAICAPPPKSHTAAEALGVVGSAAELPPVKYALDEPGTYSMADPTIVSVTTMLVAVVSPVLVTITRYATSEPTATVVD